LNDARASSHYWRSDGRDDLVCGIPRHEIGFVSPK
jgi:hypothetical protein